MDPLVSIPRDKLAELLQAAGSTMTPEEYLATLPPGLSTDTISGDAKVALCAEGVEGKVQER